MRSLRLWAVVAVAAAVGCADVTEPELPLAPDSPLAMQGASRAGVEFTLAVTGFGSWCDRELGRSGRGLIRDYEIFADVEGDMEGTAVMILNMNFDAPS